jgi:hypothetical protein
MEENAVKSGDPDGGGPRAGQTSWRAMAVPVVLAVVLSVAATLLFGGVFRPGGWGPGRVIGYGPGRGCCPPGLTDGGAR